MELKKGQELEKVMEQLHATEDASEKISLLGQAKKLASELGTMTPEEQKNKIIKRINVLIIGIEMASIGAEGKDKTLLQNTIVSLKNQQGKVMIGELNETSYPFLLRGLTEVQDILESKYYVDMNESENRYLLEQENYGKNRF